jgi:hypothetical protein
LHNPGEQGGLLTASISARNLIRYWRVPYYTVPMARMILNRRLLLRETTFITERKIVGSLDVY